MEIATTEYYGKPLMLQVPASVQPGNPFTVTVTSYGDGCVSLDSTDVVQNEQSATITPYDRRRIPTEQTVCTANGLTFVHSANIAFETTGMKTVHVHGRKQVFGAEPADVTYERSIMVE